MKMKAFALLTTALLTFGVNAADAPKELNLGILGG
jgi:phosphonate transport system substrate-binding protein